MPMHDKARQRIFRELAQAQSPEEQDWRLDTYLDYLHGATEWDARQWGLEHASGVDPLFDGVPEPTKAQLREPARWEL